MRITTQQYEKAKEKVKKLQKSQEIVEKYEAAIKSRPVPIGEALVAMQFKDGRVVYETEAKVLEPAKVGKAS